jgi:radical SAM protein with 4Fe4S-binding SPASM domain
MKSDYMLDGHKLFWHLDRVCEWQKDRLIAPIYLEISPVSYCNHNCVFCGLDFARKEFLALDAAILEKRIGEMAELGIRSIMFAGEGEPLLHPGMAEIVRTTREKGIDASITTNGMVGNRMIWESILPHLTWIRFSIDAATSKAYEQVHRVRPECFDRTLNSLREALATKDRFKLPCTIGVQFLLIEENLNDVEAAIRLYSDIGVDYLSFKPYSEHPQMLYKSGFTYSEEIISGIDSLVKQHQSTAKTTIIFRKVATASYAEGSPRFEHCYSAPFWGYISSKGDYYTCSVYLNDDRFKVGNIYDSPMESIIGGEKRRSSIDYAEHELAVGHECRVNCRMARINEFLHYVNRKPEHINFI